VLPRLPILMQFAAEHIGSFYGAFASDHRVLVEANLRCAEEFGIDQLNTMSDPYRETAGFGAPIEFPRNGVPICLKPPLEEDPDLARLPRPDPLRGAAHARPRRRRARLQGAGRRPLLDHGLGGGAGGRGGRPARRVQLLHGSARRPGLRGRADGPLRGDGDRLRPAQVAAGADTIGIGDAVASQVSAKTYESLILPHERRLVAALHGMGVRVRLHICGNIRHLLPGIATPADLSGHGCGGKRRRHQHVMSGVNPQGCQVFSFKHPSATELQHDFLWRTTRDLPERGRIGIFNRSYYEEVLIVRVHPEDSSQRRIPDAA
jgi:hypothetical protein